MTCPEEIFFPEGYLESLEAVGRIAFEVMHANGFATPEVKEAAFDIAERVREELGGAYLPRGCGFDSKRLAQAVWEEFDGTNYVDLARKHRITGLRVRQIIKEDRRKKRNPIN